MLPMSIVNGVHQASEKWRGTTLWTYQTFGGTALTVFWDKTICRKYRKYMEYVRVHT